MATNAEAIALAWKHLQASAFVQAEQVCRKVLHADFRDADAWYLFAAACQAQGKLTEAESGYREAIQLKSDYVQAHASLGDILAIARKPAEAAACYRQVLRLRPNDAQTHYNLGVMLGELGQFQDAIDQYRQALRLNPADAEALNNLGNALRVTGRLEEAVASYHQALLERPECAEMHNNLATALTDQGRHDEAIASCREALRINPQFAEAYNNLAHILERQDKFEEAIRCNEQALWLNPNLAEAYNNIGLVRRQEGRFDEAMANYQKALSLKPDHAETRWNRALLLLLQGDYEHGWPEYEWRWRRPGQSPRAFQQPAWDGSPLAGRTILLYAEQGLGDTMQVIRFVHLVKGRGGKVIVECQPALTRLLTGHPGVDLLVAQGSPLPAFDVQAALVSLPGIFRTTLANIPAEVPYLHADEKLVKHWHEMLKPLWGFKVGIAWQGNPTYRDDHRRSIPLKHFASLARISGVKLINLQKGPGVEQLKRLADSIAVYDLGSFDEASGPFMDTAAVMKNLDFVITSDTAVAHLAGALNVPVWVVLPRIPDWRWALQRDDSPWYPGMRLFRQTRFGHWEDVFQRVAAALEVELSKRRTSVL